MEVQTGNEGGGGNGSGGQEDESWMTDPAKVKEAMTKLRNENKTRRQNEQNLQTQLSKAQTDFNGLNERVKKFSGDEGSEPPEKQIETLKQSHSQIEAERDAARAEIEFINFAGDMGITQVKERRYLQFLMNEFMADKDENYEITEEELQGIVDQVVAVRPAGGNKPGSSSFGGKTPTPEGSGANSGGPVSVADFQKMTTSEKSVLYGRDPDLYNKLQQQSMPRRGAN